MVDLWPADIRYVKTKAPVTILREQASLLGEKTSNLVEAEVVTLARPDLWWAKTGTDFGYAFDIVARALGGYGYRLFQIAYGVALYPLTISVGPDMGLDPPPTVKATENGGRLFLTVESEAELRDALASIFGAKKTRQVIQAILAQSGVEPGVF